MLDWLTLCARAFERRQVHHLLLVADVVQAECYRRRGDFKLAEQCGSSAMRRALRLREEVGLGEEAEDDEEELAPPTAASEEEEEDFAHRSRRAASYNLVLAQVGLSGVGLRACVCVRVCVCVTVTESV